MNKRGQLAIFIILAIVIVALIIAYFIFRPSIIPGQTPNTPQGYLEKCMSDYAKPAVQKLSLQGGFIQPEFYKLYKDNKVAYLCYTEEYYKGCTMQVPLLKNHIEEEIKQEINGKVLNCLDSLKQDLEKKGNTVAVGKSALAIEIVPERINIKLGTDMTVTKATSQKYTQFSSSFPSPIYNHLMIASSILNWEARYGDADPLTYMIYYPDMKVEKMKLGDGTTIYTLTNKPTGQKFIFASRSFAWPAGYTTPAS